jgi:CBS domain containing-hemolysin-like protein
MLIGNTLSLVAYGIFMEEYLHHAILTNFPYITNEIVARLLASIVATILILTTSEFNATKSIFSINPDAILEFLAIPIWIVNSLMFPLVWLTVGLSGNGSSPACSDLNLFRGETSLWTHRFKPLSTKFKSQGFDRRRK